MFCYLVIQVIHSSKYAYSPVTKYSHVKARPFIFAQLFPSGVIHAGLAGKVGGPPRPRGVGELGKAGGPPRPRGVGELGKAGGPPRPRGVGELGKGGGPPTPRGDAVSAGLSLLVDRGGVRSIEDSARVVVEATSGLGSASGSEGGPWDV